MNEVSWFNGEAWECITPAESIRRSAAVGEPLEFSRREWTDKEPIYGPLLKKHGYRPIRKDMLVFRLTK